MSKKDTLCQLRTEISSLQGFKPMTATAQTDFGLGRIVDSFLDGTFPFSALHEFICASPPEVAASGAFVTGLLSPLLHKGGTALWIGTRRLVFPPALKAFGISPDQIIFIHTRSEKEALWTVEEALKTSVLTSVVGQIRDLDFTASRRLQLAIEQSGVGCFLLRDRPRNLTTASTTRWRLQPLSSSLEDQLPGVGYPRWQVELLKARNGKPGRWIVQWVQGRFQQTSTLSFLPGALQKQTG